MKAVHRDEFSYDSQRGEDAGSHSASDESPQLNDEAMVAMLPKEFAAYLPLVNKYIDSRVQAALEAERPQIVAAVKGTITQVLEQAKAAGVAVPGVTGPASREGGAIPGSPVTPEGLAWIQLLRGGGGGEENLDSFIKQASRYKAIGELFNPPPSLVERVMQTAYIRNLKKIGLVTDKDMNAVEKSLLGEIT